MEISLFIPLIKDQFIDGDEMEFNIDTKFRSLPSWDSLTGMSVLVAIKDNYGIDIVEGEFRKCETIYDVYQLVKAKGGVNA